MVDSGLDLTETDQEQEVSNEDFDMDALSANSEIDHSTLMDSNLTNEFEENNLYFCHECSTEVKSFESFEKHVENHFMEIENESKAATNFKISTGIIKEGNNSCKMQLFTVFI